jgi:uncharacterized membrane protein YhhN
MAAEQRENVRFGRLRLGVWLLWLVLLAWGVFWGQASGRIGSSLMLVLLAVSWWSLADAASRRLAGPIALGMGLGWIGDLFNAGWLRAIPLPDPTLGGMVAFGLGHVAYMYGFWVVLLGCRPLQAGWLWGGVVFWQCVAVVSWWVIVRGADRAELLIWPALPYAMLLAGTAGLATVLAAHRGGLWPVAVGAALFLVSDLILAVVLFRGSFPYQSAAVWLTYGPGQMLIVLAAWLLAGGGRSVWPRRPATSILSGGGGFPAEGIAD